MRRGLGVVGWRCGIEGARARLMDERERDVLIDDVMML